MAELNKQIDVGNTEKADIDGVIKMSDLFSEDEDSLPSGSESKRHKLGLDINSPWGWSGSNYDDYDIITVHGIRDDYKTAWIDKDGVWWVKDQLFKNLSTREIDYSYEINEDSTIFKSQGIKEHAEKLIAEYAEVRSKLEKTEIDRPVMWICHDLGGTIVKEALSMALKNPARYGKIPILTTAIIFLGTPHQCQYTACLEDQLLKLVLLQGPDIRNTILSKVKNLARQIKMTNTDFLATKLLDRAAIFNIFTQNNHGILQEQLTDSIANGKDLQERDDLSNPITPFSRYAHSIGQSFEAAGTFRLDDVDHVDLIKGDPKDRWISTVSSMFNTAGCIIKIHYRILQFQASILSLAPPTRALDTRFDPTLPKSPIVKWMYEQEAYMTFSTPGKGPRLMHLHGNGSHSIDISQMSRLLYADYDNSITMEKSGRKPNKTMIYFEFDQLDSRYNTISSMLTYFINILISKFWINYGVTIAEELTFLNDTRAWLAEDLFHLYTTFRGINLGTHQTTIFISCFDQCPETQRQWFLKRVLKEQSYSESEYRLVISTSTQNDLDITSIPNKAQINLNDCPAIRNIRDKGTRELQSDLSNLITKRPIYNYLRPQLEDILGECNDALYLGHIILDWLAAHYHGDPKSLIAEKLIELSPPTPERVVKFFFSSLPLELQPRAKNAFNWVKHALEPWSPGSLVEALTVYHFRGEEPTFNDLDTDGTMKEIQDAFSGIIIIENGDVRFSHPSLYQVPEVDVEGDKDERAAKVNSSMAEMCLNYFQLKDARAALAEISLEKFDGGSEETPLNPAVIFHPRDGMAEYAVRFWPQHFKASGKFKPTKLFYELFAVQETRDSWLFPFQLLSNPFTRMDQNYSSLLPLSVMLELDGISEEHIKSESNHPFYEKECWFAIMEAVRVGNQKILQQLLEQVTITEEQLQTALACAAASGNPDILDILIGKIPNLSIFEWPRNVIDRAAALGLDNLLKAIVVPGYDVNERSRYWNAPLATIIVWRDHVSTMEVLLSIVPNLDLTLRDKDGSTTISTAANKGNPQMIKIFLESGVNFGKIDGDNELVHCAVILGHHMAIGILIEGGAEFQSSRKGTYTDTRPPLVSAVDRGLQECVRTLLDHSADPNIISSTGTALYRAVVNEYLDIARLLLENEPKADMDATPRDEAMLLIRAIRTGNIGLVSLLITHGAKVDFVDPKREWSSTPLLQACGMGNLEMVKFLLQNKATIKHSEDELLSPLFTCLWFDKIEVAKYLLQNESVDANWTHLDGTSCLQVAHRHHDIIRELLKRGVATDARSPSGTVLHCAARRNNAKSIEALFEHDSELDVDDIYDGRYQNEIGCTPLQLACMYPAPECVEVLLKAGANAKFKNEKGYDAVDILLQTETDWDNAEKCLKLLLSEPYNAPVDDINERSETRLHKIERKTSVSFIRLLLKAKAPLDTQSQNGYTPLAIAVKKGNKNVTEYLIQEGASLNIFDPRFGSILHLAVSSGSLELVKLLIESGADCETVHPKYGESLLYTALGITDDSQLKKTVRYLVDKAKVPINKFGGPLGYPIIRAAYLTISKPPTGQRMLKFLIIRKAELNVTDSQGRRAIHIACKAEDNGGLKALLEAGAEIEVKDKFGRMPIHFAASSPFENCINYIMSKFKDTDVNVADQDNWTPLLWAARLGNHRNIVALSARNADVWVRGRASGTSNEWSALKLLNFTNPGSESRSCLVPDSRTRVNSDGEQEEWDDAFHEIQPGDWKSATCNSCLVPIVGIQWKCVEYEDDFSLCFKCYGYRSLLHNPEHSFEDIEPMYA